MKPVLMLIELEPYDMMYNEDSPEEVKWFYDFILGENPLLLYSEEIGDYVGSVRVLEVRRGESETD